MVDFSGAFVVPGVAFGEEDSFRLGYACARDVHVGGLAAISECLRPLGLAVAVGRLVPALIDASHVEFGILGIGYGALGVVLLLIGAYRAHRVRAALVADRPLPMDAWTVWLLTVAGLVLAAATLVMLVAEI